MNRKFYITTSIAYTNAPPHIGFALELIQADVLARYRRLSGEDVFFLTGTDEHGAKVVKAAESSGKTPEEFTEEISVKFRELAKILNISNDDFIRTTDQKKHWPSVQKVWLKLKESGDIYKKNYRGLYCSGCEAFITEKDLIEGKCKIHQREPEAIEEENYFFRLSKYSKEIEKIIESDEVRIIPQTRKNEILSFVRQGLEDVSFSRPRKDLKWAVPAPDDDTASIYVWADALVNYISALGYDKNSQKFKKYWPADVHCVGKDILKFHGAIWPGMLLSLGLPLPKAIFVHGFITVAGRKMSKSLGNVVDPFELANKYGADAVRYFLLREIPPTKDGDFTIEKFEQRYNADLANGIGNLLSRNLVMVEKKFNGTIPKNYKSPELVGEMLDKYKEYIKKIYFNEAVAKIFEMVKYINENIDKLKIYSKSPQEVGNDLYVFLEMLRIIAWMLSPFMPETADKIFRQLGLDLEKEKKRKFDEAIKWGGLKPGTKIKKSESLFPRI